MCQGQLWQRLLLWRDNGAGGCTSGIITCGAVLLADLLEALGAHVVVDGVAKDVHGTVWKYIMVSQKQMAHLSACQVKRFAPAALKYEICILCVPSAHKRGPRRRVSHRVIRPIFQRA